MKVSLDGGVTYQDADINGVRVIQEDDERHVELHFNFTDEGLITDVWEQAGHESPESEGCIGTSARGYDDILFDLIGDE